MIICNRRNLLDYQGSLPGIGNALKTLEGLGPSPRPCRVEFESGFLFIQEGDTAIVEDGTFEAHRRHIDVQVMLKGCERVLWSDLEDLDPDDDYDPVKDKQVLSGEGAVSFDVPEGMCWAAFPDDAHMACRDPGERTRFLKAVIKLEIPHGGSKEA